MVLHSVGKGTGNGEHGEHGEQTQKPIAIFAIDPGPKESAFLVISWSDGEPYFDEFGKLENRKLLDLVRLRMDVEGVHYVIEMIASYGMAVGAEIFETCLFIGQLLELLRDDPRFLIYRKEVALHLCQSPRAKDSNVRAAMIDRWGAPGTSKAPGMTYGIAKDTWSALAIATTFADLSQNEEWKNEHRRT